MSNIISALVTVFGIMLLGLFAERRRFLAPTMALCLNQFVYWISLPSLLFTQMCNIPTGEETGTLIWSTLLASLICYLLFYLVFSRCFRANTPEASLRTLGGSFPNAAFFGLPFIIMILPGNEHAITAAVLSALLYTGVLLIADATLDLQHSPSGNGLAKKLLLELAHNPMLISSTAGACISLSGAIPPDALLKMTGMLGSTAAPCALFGMGMVLSAQLSSSSGFRSLKATPIILVSTAKLLLQPLITFTILKFAGCTGTALASAAIIAAMPVGTMVYVLSERYETRPMEASLTVLLTTVLSLMTLPLVIFLLETAGLM